MAITRLRMDDLPDPDGPEMTRGRKCAETTNSTDDVVVAVAVAVVVVVVVGVVVIVVFVIVVFSLAISDDASVVAELPVDITDWEKISLRK